MIRILKRIARSMVQLVPLLDRYWLRHQVLETPLTQHYPYEAEAKIVQVLVSPGETFLDVGAHDGFYSILVEPIVGAANVYSFEPIPHTYQRLKRRRRSDRVFQLALSKTKGQQTIRIPLILGERFTTRATLETEIREIGETGFEELTVTLSTIDQFVQTHPISQIGCIKIDVEGHELHVIEGAFETLKRFQPVLLIEMEQRHHAQPLRSAISWIEGLGYVGYYLDATALKLRSLDSFSIERDQAIEHHKTSRYIQNFLFFPPSQQAALVQKIESRLAQETVHPEFATISKVAQL